MSDKWMTTWAFLIQREADTFGDKLEDMVFSMDDSELYREFHGGYGADEGCPFTAWSDTRVYFPLSYDGLEYVGSAPRFPCDERLRHQ